MFIKLANFLIFVIEALRPYPVMELASFVRSVRIPGNRQLLTDDRISILKKPILF